MKILIPFTLAAALFGTLNPARSQIYKYQSSTYVEAMQKAIEKGDLLSARRFAQQAVMIAEYDETKFPRCGDTQGRSNIIYTAFPTGRADQLYSVNNGRLSFYQLKNKTVSRTWQVGISNRFGKKTLSPSNPMSRQFSNKSSGMLNIDFQCGQQPKWSKQLTQFIVSTPPGYVEAGYLKSDGSFLLKSTKQFDGNTREPIVYGLPQRYAEWIMDLP